MFAYIQPFLACHLFNGFLELILIHAVAHPDLGLSEHLSECLARPLQVLLQLFQYSWQGSESRQSVDDSEGLDVLPVVRLNVQEFYLPWLLGGLELLEKLDRILHR